MACHQHRLNTGEDLMEDGRSISRRKRSHIETENPGRDGGPTISSESASPTELKASHQAPPFW